MTEMVGSIPAIKFFPAIGKLPLKKSITGLVSNKYCSTILYGFDLPAHAIFWPSRLK